MLAIDVLYNLAMLAVDAAALQLARRRGGRVFLPVALAALGAVTLAAALGGGAFGGMRLVAWGLFVHGPLVLTGAGLLRRRTRRDGHGLLALAALLVATGVWAFLVEPGRLEVNRVRLESPKLRRPLRIVIVADLQTDEIGDYEREALRRVVEERPDVVLFAGDYLQAGERERPVLRERLRAAMREVGLAAPEGVYVVQGNVDAEDWALTFAGLGFQVFDRTRTVERADLAVTGLAMLDSFDTGLAVPARDRFHIALGHAPDFALGRVEADLLVAGHTHGGQVRLPLIGPLLTLTAVPRDWAAGVTPLDGGRTLVVSRGVGMERDDAPRLRFNCPPEIVVVEAVPGGR